MRSHPQRGGLGRSGFTLVEVVVALGILLMGVTVLLGMLTFGAAATRSANLRLDAAGAVEAVVADLEEHLFPLEADGRAGPPRTILERSIPGHEGLTYSAIATPHEAHTDADGRPVEYRVEIEIAFTAGGLARKRSFQTLLLREVPFGTRLRRELLGEEDPLAEIPATRSTGDPP